MKTKANPQKPSNMTEVFVREPKPENVTEKVPQTINHDDTKHVLTSSIIKDEKMKGIMDKFDSVVSSNMIRKQKIDEVNEHIESEQSDIQSYLELVSQREEAIEALNRKKSSIESQYKEVEILIEVTKELHKVYEEQLTREFEQRMKAEADLKSSNRHTYRTFKQKTIDENQKTVDELNATILELKSKIVDLEGENQKLLQNQYVGSKKNRYEDSDRTPANIALLPNKSMDYAKIKGSLYSTFLMRFVVRDSKKKERIIVNRLVLISKEKRGDGIIMKMHDILSGSPVEMYLKDIINKIYETHIEMLDDDVLSKFYDEIMKMTNKPSFDVMYKNLFNGRSIFTPADLATVTNFVPIDVK